MNYYIISSSRVATAVDIIYLFRLPSSESNPNDGKIFTVKVLDVCYLERIELVLKLVYEGTSYLELKQRLEYPHTEVILAS